MPAALKHLTNMDQLGGTISSLLAAWKDGLFYSVEVLECDLKKGKCRVKFEDDYECWMDHKDLHIQFNDVSLQDEHIVCCMCDGGASEPPNEIIMCDVCQQGFHVQCHQPPIDRDLAKLDDEETEWSCQTCTKIVSSQQPSQASNHAKIPPPSTPPKPGHGSSPKSKSARKAATARPKSDRKISKSARKVSNLKIRLDKKAERALVDKGEPKTKPPKTKELPDVKTDPEENKTKDSSPEVQLTCSPRTNQSTNDNAIVEEITDPLVLLTAQNLAEADISKMETSNFVEIITEEKKQVSDDSIAVVPTKTKANIRSHGSSRRKVVTSAISKGATVAAAAAAAAAY